MPARHQTPGNRIHHCCRRQNSGCAAYSAITSLRPEVQAPENFLFETEAAAGRTVIEVTGTDLAAFCDTRLPEQHDAYRAKLRANLNEVAQKLA